MTIELVVGTGLPFFLAFLIQALEGRMRPLAENTLKTYLSDTESLEGWARTIAIDLTRHFYSQFSFFVSISLGTASSLALALTSTKPLAGLLVGFIFVCEMVAWSLRWQPLARTPGAITHRKFDREMLIASLTSNAVLMGLSYYVNLV